MLKSQESRAAGRVEASAKALSCSCGKIKNQGQGLSALYFGRYESRPDPVPGAVLIAECGWPRRRAADSRQTRAGTSPEPAAWDVWLWMRHFVSVSSIGDGLSTRPIT